MLNSPLGHWVEEHADSGSHAPCGPHPGLAGHV